MKAVAAVAEILKREGVKFLIGYPVNPIIEAAAQADIRTIIVRQERTGLHMADAVSRVTSGRAHRRLHHAARPRLRERLRRRGPGLRRLRAHRGPARRLSAAHHQYPAQLQLVTQLPARDQVDRAGDHVRHRARRHAPRFHPGQERAPASRARGDSPSTSSRRRSRSRSTTWWRRACATALIPQAVSTVAAALVAAERPVIYAGQGVHYAQAWSQLRQLAELLEAPVTTSLQGKSAFPENHPLVARLGRPLGVEAAPRVPEELRRDLRHRLQLRHHQLRGGHAQGQDHHPLHARPRGRQQGRAGGARADRRRRPHASMPCSSR